MTEPRRIMVDVSATLIHHGHIRILKAAKQMGTVIVALTTNEEVRAMKGYDPELDYEARKEILESIRYVDEVVPCKWLLDDAFLDQHRIDLLVHGSDNRNPVSPERLVTLPRTPGISSMLLRARVLEAVGSMMRREVR
jgi:glycerol-3-phosphate cytidylyltransferase